MGTYEQEAAIVGEQIESAASPKFGLERDLQSALRTNITQLEEGLLSQMVARRGASMVFALI